MSSVVLADVESKINEVRNRLTNLSISLNCNEATTTTTTSPVLTAGVKGHEARSSTVLSERNMNESRGQKSDTSIATGGLDRLVELARREAAHRQPSNHNHHQNNNSHNINNGITGYTIPQPVYSREARNTSRAPSEKPLTGLKAHTYYDTTGAATQSKSTHHITPAALSRGTTHPSVMPQRSVPLQTSAERFDKLHNNTTKAQSMRMPGTSATFDPFVAVEARLRDKLRKTTLCTTTDSSPVDSTKSSSPKIKDVLHVVPLEFRTDSARNSQSDISPNATQIWNDKSEGEKEKREQYDPVTARIPSVKAAAAAIRNVREQLPLTGMNRAPLCSSSRSSAVDVERRHYFHNHHPHHQQQPQQQQQSRPKLKLQDQQQKWTERIPQRSSAMPVQMNVHPRSSSITRRERSVNQSCHQTERQPKPRRPSSVTSQRSSSSFRAQSPIPLKTAPQRTVLDVLTGAEVFALLRLRGTLVSRGDTGECGLPDTRCHSIYLSTDEHKQLVELRASLRLHSFSSSIVTNTIDGRPSSARGRTSTTTTPFDRMSRSERKTPSRDGFPQR